MTDASDYVRLVMSDAPARGGNATLSCLLCHKSIAPVGGGGLGALCRPCHRRLYDGEVPTDADVRAAERRGAERMRAACAAEVRACVYLPTMRLVRGMGTNGGHDREIVIACRVAALDLDAVLAGDDDGE